MAVDEGEAPRPPSSSPMDVVDEERWSPPPQHQPSHRFSPASPMGLPDDDEEMVVVPPSPRFSPMLLVDEEEEVPRPRVPAKVGPAAPPNSPIDEEEEVEVNLGEDLPFVDPFVEDAELQRALADFDPSAPLPVVDAYVEQRRLQEAERAAQVIPTLPPVDWELILAAPPPLPVPADAPQRPKGGERTFIRHKDPAKAARKRARAAQVQQTVPLPPAPEPGKPRNVKMITMIGPESFVGGKPPVTADRVPRGYIITDEEAAARVRQKAEQRAKRNAARREAERKNE